MKKTIILSTVSLFLSFSSFAQSKFQLSDLVGKTYQGMGSFIREDDKASSSENVRCEVQVREVIKGFREVSIRNLEHQPNMFGSMYSGLDSRIVTDDFNGNLQFAKEIGSETTKLRINTSGELFEASSTNGDSTATCKHLVEIATLNSDVNVSDSDRQIFQKSNLSDSNKANSSSAIQQ